MSLLRARLVPRLHTRLGLTVGLIILLLTIGLALLMAQRAEEQVLLQSAANLEGLSRQMARELSVGMDRSARAVETQTVRDRFRDAASSPASMRAALDQFKRTNPEFAWVSVLDAETGVVLAASGGIFEQGSTRGRPVFERGRSGPFIGDVHDAVRLAELLPRPANGEALRFLDVAAPIRDTAGRITRVFATHVGWEWTDALRADIFGPLKATSGIEALLIDSQGKVVLAATTDVKVGEDVAHLVPEPGEARSAVTVWPGHIRYLTAAASTTPHGSFPGFGWRVVARQPIALAAAPASGLRTAFLFGALGFGLLGAAVAWAATGWITRPVRRLTAAAERAQGAGATAPDGATFSRRAGDELSSVQHVLEELADTAKTNSLAYRDLETRFASLADSLPQVVFQVDASGVVDYVNRPSRVFAVEGGGLNHLLDLQSCMPGLAKAAFAAAWAACVAGETDLKMRCQLVVDGGETRWFDIDARTVRTSRGATKWVGTLLDVHELATHAERTFEAFVRERDARLEAERLAGMRDQFLAVVSHELRSPLSVITGWSDILKRKGSDNPTVARAAEVIRINARIQTGLINDLLDMTAAMAGRLTLHREPVDLVRLGNEVLLSQLHGAQAKGVGLVCQASAAVVMVEADRRRIAQIFSNLLGNAIKFTDAGGSITLEIDRADGRAVVRVRDTGVGIDPAFLPHVFEHMRQADSSKTRRAGGLGLGLAIVRSLATLHDGEASAQSDGLGSGSTFTLSLPLIADTLEAADIPDDSGGDFVELPNLRVLLVDDEPDARDVAQVALSSLGAEVRVASSAAEVLAILEKEIFDVLVSDIGMPEMDGLTMMRRIRSSARPAVRDMPAVALSAFAMESDRRAGMEAGFGAYVAKPISLRRLADAIASATRTGVAA